MRTGRVVAIVLAVLVAAGLATLVTKAATTKTAANARQDALEPFYAPPDPLPPEPGTVIRQEPLDTSVDGGTAYRVLYTSALPDDTPVAASAMVFVPSAPAPAGGRPVVAWAHGTIGMGDACAPSRSANPTGPIDTWLTPMLDRGWVVVATDYAGLGTPGQELYLVGESEARDVVNSVIAARNMAQTDAGTRWVVYGHSQGGHAALWTGQLAAGLAPDLDLLGVAAAAPAANLTDIMSAQYSGRVGWVIGPEVVQSWRSLDPSLPLDRVVTPSGIDATSGIANECIVQAALESIVRERFQGQYFAKDPLTDPAWAAATKAQVPAPLPASMPMLLVQSTADTVVLAWPNAALQETWCAAGSDLSAIWIGNVGHNDTGLAAGPAVVTWATERFDGTPTQRNCMVAPPIAPTPA